MFLKEAFVNSPISSRTYPRFFSQVVLSVLTLAFLSVTQATAQSAQVTGVKNFGRVTDRFFRGGAVTPEGVENLAQMGVRTIIDLRDSPDADEPAVCKDNGIRYLNFPMTGHEAPSNQDVGDILHIIQTAKEPVYVHCSAGKHRSGTIAALYRTRVQGWSKEKAWAEQQSYGFGTPEEHPELYDYVYGSQAREIALNDAPSDEDRDYKDDGKSEGKKHKSSKYSKDDGDHGYKDDEKSEGKKHKSSKSSKDDDDHGHKDHGKKDGHGKKKD